MTITDICGWKCFGQKIRHLIFFKNIKLRAETESGKRLKGLRTDRGGEFVGNSLTLCGEGVKAWFIRLRVQPLIG